MHTRTLFGRTLMASALALLPLTLAAPPANAAHHEHDGDKKTEKADGWSQAKDGKANKASKDKMADGYGEAKDKAKDVKKEWSENAKSDKSNKADLVETAVLAGNFKTLLKAAAAAGLADTLANEGPFTVFAPTDEAFAALPEETLNALLAPEKKEILRTLLLYHVVEGKVKAADAKELDHAQTLSGDIAVIRIDDEMARIDTANIVKTDVMAGNGVIHVIDRVISPLPNLVQRASSAGEFSTLLAAAQAAGLADKLANDGPFTVFAPTDQAFENLPEGTVESLLKPENKEKLKRILSFHVVPGFLPSNAVVGQTTLPTAAGESLNLQIMDDKLHIENATLLQADVRAGNGVIHVIDAVMMPGDTDAAASKGTKMERDARVQATPAY